LKLPTDGRQERINELVRTLQLESCLKTFVGDDTNSSLKTISGGEKRRLAIATQILDPSISILVLDEPTSGLDAATALNVVKLLRSLADKEPGIVVITTLHQPRGSIMACFDDLMILDKGSRVYYGPLSSYLPYLDDELKCEIPLHESPYDLILDVLNPRIGLEQVRVRDLSDSCTDLSKFFNEKYAMSSLRKQMDERSPNTSGGLSIKDLAARPHVSWLVKCLTIFHRTFIIKYRDPKLLMSQIISTVIYGLLFGIVYWQSYEKQYRFAVLDIQMALTMIVTVIIFIPQSAISTFPSERKIFLRERKAGLYPTSAFFVARITADMPMHMLVAAIMVCFVYPMCGFRMGFGWLLLVCEVVVLVGAAIIQMIGALCRTFEEANILLMMTLMTSMILTTGFVREVPSWLSWARDISILGINGDIAMYLEFHDFDSQFVGESSDQVFLEYGGLIKNNDEFLRAMGINAGVYVVARFVTYLAVKFLHTGRHFMDNLAD